MRNIAAVIMVVVSSLIGPVAGASNVPALDWTPRSDWVNVKTAFGAVGDGVHDDAPNIQAGIDATGSGETLYFPPGTYRIGATLSIDKHPIGMSLIGCGSKTTLSWAGPAGANLLVDYGGSRKRFIGFVFDGHNSAAVGFDNSDFKSFDTETRWQNIDFRNFSVAGLQSDPKANMPIAETSIENCIFDHCAQGIVITKYNDYDFNIAGCDFLACGAGIHCVHGNFYARECFFEGSKIADIVARGAEHGCSIRRCKSEGSAKFVDYACEVSPLSVDDCFVAGWTGDSGAIALDAPPVSLHQVTFANPPDRKPAIRCASGQVVIACALTTVPGAPVFADPRPNVYDISAGPTPGVVSLSGAKIRSFVNPSPAVPSRIFDAAADFGAKGDGVADDTAALQKTIDAAAKYGKGALAYVPHGIYRVSATLNVTGADYAFGGSGLRSALIWSGPKGASIVSVDNPQRIRIENIAIGHGDNGIMDDAYDVDVTASGPCKLTCDGLYVYGMYQKTSAARGLRLNRLGPGAAIVLEHFQGNLDVFDSARATVIGNDTYEGAITVDDSVTQNADGFLGFMMRLTTGDVYPLIVKHSNSIILTDYYTEQGWNGPELSGDAANKPGLVVISGPKCQFSPGPGEPPHFLTIDNYRGVVVYGPDQFYTRPNLFDIEQSGANPVDVILLGNAFYGVSLTTSLSGAGRLIALGNQLRGARYATDNAKGAAPEDSSDSTAANALTAAFDRYARLGQYDIALNFGWLK